MMKPLFILTTLLFSLLAFNLYAATENYSKSEPILCSVTQVNECVAWQGCESVDPFAANIPYFMEINLAKKTISGSSTVNMPRTSKIERIETIDDLITLSGAEPKSKEDRTKFGWMMTISTSTGEMNLSANTNDSVIVVFGSCLNKD